MFQGGRGGDLACPGKAGCTDKRTYGEGLAESAAERPSRALKQADRKTAVRKRPRSRDLRGAGTQTAWPRTLSPFRWSLAGPCLYSHPNHLPPSGSILLPDSDPFSRCPHSYPVGRWSSESLTDSCSSPCWLVRAPLCLEGGFTRFPIYTPVTPKLPLSAPHPPLGPRVPLELSALCLMALLVGTIQVSVKEIPM